MTNKKPAKQTPNPANQSATIEGDARRDAGDRRAPEIGGPRGREPTRYGDWEKNGRCIDF